MDAREYVESVALALSRLRAGGLLLSPVDAQLALSWHAAGVPIEGVLHVLKTGRQRLRAGGARTRGAQPPALSLQAFAFAIQSLARAQPRTARAPFAPPTLQLQLLQAARRPRLPARAAWEELAGQAEALISASRDAYWTGAIAALRQSLRELPRAAALRAGTLLRSRLARRPREMPRARYRRSLQLQLLCAASETLDVPPAAFLL